MNPQYGRFLKNPYHRREAERELERQAAVAIEPVPLSPEHGTVPTAVVALKLEDLGYGDWVGRKWVGPCPACQADGGDSNGVHLVVWDNKKWGCVAHEGESGIEHRRRMAKLCPVLLDGGIYTTATPLVDTAAQTAARDAAVAVIWAAVKKDLAGGLDALGDTAPIPTDPRGQFEAWCNLWGFGERAWVGERLDTPSAFRRHCFYPAVIADRERAWTTICREGLDHARGVVWKHDAQSRKGDQALGFRLAVVEHDHESLPGQIALVRYARLYLGWALVMVIHTGGKGIHGLFDVSAIPPDRLKSDAAILAQMGADKQSLGKSQTRVPGVIRQADDKTPGGQMQKILWINPHQMPVSEL